MCLFCYEVLFFIIKMNTLSVSDLALYTTCVKMIHAYRGLCTFGFDIQVSQLKYYGYLPPYNRNWDLLKIANLLTLRGYTIHVWKFCRLCSHTTLFTVYWSDDKDREAKDDHYVLLPAKCEVEPLHYVPFI